MSDKFIIDIKENNQEIDVILGHDKHILRGYKRNNVKMLGGWYFRNIKTNVDFLLGVIAEYGLTRVNFIGTSKSCSGAIVLTKEIAPLLPEVQFKLFLFSPYTTIDRAVFVKRNIEEPAPGSLKSFWSSDKYTPSLIRRFEARGLVDKDNVLVYMFYPEKSKQGEPVLAKRVSGENIIHVGLPVWMHNTLYPLWKKVEADMTIEIYESEFREMHPTDFAFYTHLQNYPCYSFNLYSCVENMDRFIKNLEAFKENFIAEQEEAKKNQTEDAPAS